MHRKKIVVCVAGPTGVGKDTVVENFLKNHDGFIRVPRCTTRKSRPGEVDGYHYHFLSRKEFIKRQDACRIFAVDEFCGELYGIDLEEITHALLNGRHVIGAFGICSLAIKDMFHDQAKSIYVKAPLDVLEKRMRERGDPLEKIPERLIAAARQLEQEPRLFDHVVENVGDILETIAAIITIIGDG